MVILVIPIVLILGGCSTKVDTHVKSLTTKLEHIDLRGAQTSHDVCTLHSYYLTARSLHELLLPERVRWFKLSQREAGRMRQDAANICAQELSRRIKEKETSFDCLEEPLEVSTLYGVSKTLETLSKEEMLDTSQLVSEKERREALVDSAKKQTPQLFLHWQFLYAGEWCLSAKRLLSFVEDDHISVSELGITEDLYQDLKTAKAKAHS